MYIFKILMPKISELDFKFFSVEYFLIDNIILFSNFLKIF